MIEAGDRVTIPDRPGILEVVQTIPDSDWQDNRIVWAIVRDERGRTEMIDAENLEVMSADKHESQSKPFSEVGRR